MPRHEGGCLCGEVRFAVSADPMRVTVCHCHFCQRNTGTAYLVEPVFTKAQFRFTSGAPRTYDAISAGSGSRPSFCTSWRSTCTALLSFSTMCTGMRIVRDLSAIARVTACRIHHVA